MPTFFSCVNKVGRVDNDDRDDGERFFWKYSVHIAKKRRSVIIMIIIALSGFLFVVIVMHVTWYILPKKTRKNWSSSAFCFFRYIDAYFIFFHCIAILFQKRAEHYCISKASSKLKKVIFEGLMSKVIQLNSMNFNDPVA